MKTQADNNNNLAATTVKSEPTCSSERINECGFYQTADSGQTINFYIKGQGSLVALSEILPVLENMGVRVISANSRSYEGAGWLVKLCLSSENGTLIGDPLLQHNFRQLFKDVIQNRLESDGFNRLVSVPGIRREEIIVVRAIARYLQQIDLPFSQNYIEEVLNRHSHITELLVCYFRCKFDPETFLIHEKRTDKLEQLKNELTSMLDQLTRRDEDRILRTYLSVISAMVRTNFYKSYSHNLFLKALSFKLKPALIEGVPEPVPAFETFVSSPRVEGVHLRGGKVSRGGIRWSDRREDYRTEILGLVKAQMVKNAVIVPVGAKGGFIIKEGDREQLIIRYSEFIAALLDITDNLKNGEIVAPENVVRYDDDDPYLVVAADKGTAVLSDVANTVARGYEFWLGDAFASGGANGYDHKKMGITARGAWQSTQRLFKELGLDCQTEDFTAVAIGDMSGDVFGNGMLLSEHIRLVAAFNHQHIFIDPEPDAASGFTERQRLFRLPVSSWMDYSPELISEGGGVFERSQKTILLNRQIRGLCGLSESVTRLTPDELIRHLLKAPVDLLWNGGIGTYIKASGESDAEVGDRANDPVRINASDVGARVVVEGGNLGLTQAGRIEYASLGGRITTDAIDNSGGVDCSDHEVNIKILLQQLMDSNQITLQQRNQLLDEMTDDVAGLVLKNNYQQSKMLSQSNHTSARFIDKHAQLIQLLEKKGLLNTELEQLPGRNKLHQLVKTRQGLTRPELSVLLAYSKSYLFNKLVDSDLIEDDLICRELMNYFPEALQRKFPEAILNHPLGREILAAQLTNQIANRMGSTFCNNLLDVNRTDPVHWVKSHIAAREIFQTAELGLDIESLGFSVPNSVQMELYLKLHYPMERAAQWLQNNIQDHFDTGAVVERFRPWVSYLRDKLMDLLSASEQQALLKSVTEFTDQGVPEELAIRLSSLDYLYHALDISEVALKDKREMERVVNTVFRINGEMDLFWLRRYLDGIPNHDQWHRSAKDLLSENIDRSVRERARDLLNQLPLHDTDRIGVANPDYQELLQEVRALPVPNLATVTVAVSRISL